MAVHSSPDRRRVLKIGSAAAVASLTGGASAAIAFPPDRRGDWHRATATELAAALRLRKISATELCQAMIARIERLDPQINAVVVRDFERALAEAKAADRALQQGDRRRLLGVPMTVKESFDLQGYPTTIGLESRRQHRATSDAEAIRRARAAGAIILGKTNVPTNLADSQTVNPVYGRTHNPYDTTRSPGGSSGGSAAALAAGFAALELGSDAGGSIRTPAAFCGVYGLKTSFGVVSSIGHGGTPREISAWGAIPSTMQVMGPLARSAEDLRLLLAVIAGPDEGSPATSLILPEPRQRKLADYRVFIVDDYAPATVSSEVLKALADVETTLMRAGAVVGRRSDRLPDLAETRRLHRTFFAGPGPQTSASEWIGNLRSQAHLRAGWAAFFEDFDIVLSPTFSTTAYPNDDVAPPDRRLFIEGDWRAFRDQTQWTAIASVCKLPAAVAPVAVGEGGLPIGLQVIAPFLHDLTAIEFARLIGREIPPPAMEA